MNAHPTPEQLRIWSVAWRRRKAKLYQQLIASYTPEQRRIVAEMNEAGRNDRLARSRLRWPEGSTGKATTLIAWPEPPPDDLRA